MRNRIAVVSHDATLPEYLPGYGDRHMHMPNVERLAAKGTVFMNHYTAAPSTLMAFTSMWTDTYCHELDRKFYLPVDHVEFTNNESVFSIMENEGYTCHVIWSTNYHPAHTMSQCFGSKTIFHENKKINRACGANGGLNPELRKDNEAEVQDVLDYIEDALEQMCAQEEKTFLWVHMPHCVNGRTSYGSDMDVFDRVVGMVAERFGDDNIYVTADHGHMNGKHGKYEYGFDVYEKPIRIPLITPRIAGKAQITFNTSSVQLKELILEGDIKERDILYSDCAYYMQMMRKMVVMHKNYRYIYNKRSKTEEFYDVAWDPEENFNLLAPKGRKKPGQEAWGSSLYYPFYQEAMDVADRLRKCKDEVWRNGNPCVELWVEFRKQGSRVKRNIKNAIKRIVRPR